MSLPPCAPLGASYVDSVMVTPSGGGFVLEGERAPPPRGALGHPAAPAMPALYELVGGARIYALPPPPLLARSDLPGRHAHLLRRWFEGAVETRFGKRCSAFHALRGHIMSSKYMPLLTAFAAACLDNDIVPASYIAWSIEFWLHDDKKKGAPPVNWMFSVPRLMKRMGWFEAEGSYVEGGLLQYGPAARAYAARRARLLAALASVPDHATDADVRTLVRCVFAPGECESMTEAVRTEATQTALEYAQGLYAGDWLWA